VWVACGRAGGVPARERGNGDQIYLLRHGIAEDRSPSGQDADRRLTGDGREKLRRVLERARDAKVTPSLILTSPLVRARETAEIAARVLGYEGEVAVTAALAPDSTPRAVWQEITRRPGESAILLAGHEPLYSAVTAYLLNAPSLQIDFKKAGLVRIDMDRLSGEPWGVLQWVLTPRLAG
jgi:phosphohistidine phosphatase